MQSGKYFEVIIVGGSYSGLAAAMALGRSLRQTLVIDSAQPCNRQTPASHNFLTQDGQTPNSILMVGKQQVERYSTVQFFNGLAIKCAKADRGFEVEVASGETFRAGRLIFATGISDILPDIDGFAACWGISVLHCPYCHGYEARNEKTGVLANGEYGFEFAGLISNWTNDLTLYTNGTNALTAEQTRKLVSHGIKIEQNEVGSLEHLNGHLQHIVFRDGSKSPVSALYSPVPFKQHCQIPETLGCRLTEDGFIEVDAFHKTTVEGIFACGDNVTRMRTLANAVAMGATAGMVVNKEIVLEKFSMNTHES